jgi:hypothetical protein
MIVSEMWCCMSSPQGAGALLLLSRMIVSVRTTQAAKRSDRRANNIPSTRATEQDTSVPSRAGHDSWPALPLLVWAIPEDGVGCTIEPAGLSYPHAEDGAGRRERCMAKPSNAFLLVYLLTCSRIETLMRHIRPLFVTDRLRFRSYLHYPFRFRIRKNIDTNMVSLLFDRIRSVFIHTQRWRTTRSYTLHS